MSDRLMVVFALLTTLITAPVARSQPASAETPAEDLSVLREKFLPRTFVDPSGERHGYRLLMPDGYQEDDVKKYPLVVFLHGAGERGNDNLAQLKHGAYEFARPERQMQYPCFLLAPQCPKEEKWVDVNWGSGSGQGTFPETPSDSMQATLGMIDHWTKTGRVDTDRIYLTGLSMGGYGSWFAAGYAPERFAAVVPICGGGDPTWAARYGQMPIWAFHGSADKAVPVDRSREMISALKQSGHSPEPIYTEYEGGPHDVWTQTYARDDLFRWLFSQRRAAR